MSHQSDCIETRSTKETNEESAVKSIHKATEIARDYAHQQGVNEAKAEAYAEVWFDASKDFDRSGPEALIRHLDLKFERV